MTEEFENRSLEGRLEFEGDEDEISKSGKAKITYTRALLLEFAEAEACRKLPEDFDMLILSQLNEAVDRRCWEEDLAAAFMEKYKRISSSSSVLGASPYGGWDTGFPGERWGRHLLMPSKESHLQGNCSTERSDVVSQQIPQESGYDAVVSGQKAPKSAYFKSFQLRHCGNPYRPPHLNKLPQPSDTFSELGVESSETSCFSTVESDQRDSSDRITENDESVYVSPLASEMTGANEKPDSEIIDDNGPTYEDFWAEILEKLPQECEEASCSDNSASGTIGATDKLGLGIIGDNQSAYEDIWADILESLRRQQEAELAHTSGPDAEVDICLPDEDSLISVDNFIMLENSDDAVNSETEIIWPDEDSLISRDDIIGPYSSVPVDTEQPFFQLGDNDIMNFHTTLNYIPYIPGPNCFNCSNFLYQSRFTGTNPNNSLSQYSLSQQPYRWPRQQYHPSVDTMCRNPIKQVALQQPTYQGLGKSNAGDLSNKEASGFWHARH